MELGSGIYIFGIDILYVFTYSMFAIYFSIAYKYIQKRKNEKSLMVRHNNQDTYFNNYEEIIDVEIIGGK